MHRNIITVLIATTLGALTATGIADAAPTARLREGMQVVGQDVQSGTYNTAGPRSQDYGYCFITWLPYKGAKSSEAIDMESYSGASYVQLKDGDVVNVEGCVWTHE
ncbi:hypothetical protein [Nocardia sp. NBC_01388]|uniref:hypothetical protein n=1 Tax=Nocardia sp. NBC_01388 TaxID=2903596 RepID=UPI00324680A5